MKKYLVILLLVLVPFSSFSQVGIGTNTPNSNSILELQSTDKALLLTRVANTSAIASPVNGMMIYDLSTNCVKSYENSVWSGCWSTESSTPPALVYVDCSKSGFQGNNIIKDNAIDNMFYKVVISNNTSSAVTISLASSDLVLSGSTAGAPAVSVGIVSTSEGGVGISSITIPAATIQAIFYKINGTPSSSGLLTGVWTKLSLSCQKSINVSDSFAKFDCSNLTQSELLPSNLYLTNGQSYTQTITVPYTQGSGAAYGTAQTVSQGLTLTRVAGTYDVGGGSVTYNLTGTYTGETGSNFVTFIPSDCACTVQVNAHSVSLVANSGVPLQMDNLKISFSTSGNRQPIISSVRKNANFVGGATYMHKFSDGANGTATANTPALNLSTTPSQFISVVGGWHFIAAMDQMEIYLRDTSNNRWYRITTIVGPAYNNNLYHIERMDVNIPEISIGANVTKGVDVTIDNVKARVNTGNTHTQISANTGSFIANTIGYYGQYSNFVATLLRTSTLTVTTAPVSLRTSDAYTAGNIQRTIFTDNLNNTYKITAVFSSDSFNHLTHIEKLSSNATAGMSRAGYANQGVGFSFDNYEVRMPSSATKSMNINTTSGSPNVHMGAYTSMYDDSNVFQFFSYYRNLTTSPQYINGWHYTIAGAPQFTHILNENTLKYTNIIMIVGYFYNNNFFYIKRY